MPRVGLVALDRDAKWIGGRYYLHHLIRSVRSQSRLADLRFCDVWWGEMGPEEAFGEVKDLLDDSVIIRPPTTLRGRAVRYVRRRLTRSRGAADLFRSHDVSVMFPIPACDDPGIPYVFWLSDFQYIHLPELFGPDLVAHYESYFTRHVSAAAAVVVSSEHAASDFERVFPKFVRKVRIVRFCSVPTEEWWAKGSDSTAREYGVEDPYFVLSNQFSHHKNHDVVFEAVRILRDRGVHVVVVCTGSTFGFRGPEYYDRLKSFIDRHELSGSIRILGLVPRADQIALTRGAVAVLQPSRFEGWSTIIEDARSLGKRVLASNIPVHREQLAAEVDPLLPVDDPEAWAVSLQGVLEAREQGNDQQGVGFDAATLESRMAACADSFSSAVDLALSR